jgi:hypothetical protein
MPWKSVSTALVLSLFVGSCDAWEEEHRQTIAEMRDVALKTVEKNRPVSLLLKSKREGKEKFNGRPEKISEQGFTLVSLSTGQETEFAF